MHNDDAHPPAAPGDDETQPVAAQRRRLAWSVGLAVAALVGATVAYPSARDDHATGPDLIERQHARAAASLNLANAESIPHTHGTTDPLTLALDGHTHNHADPTTKNLLSRSTAGGVTDATRDPTTPRQAAAHAAAVAAQRAEPDPRTVPVAERPQRRAVPEDRYAMAGGCYALHSARTGRWVSRYGAGFRAAATGRGSAAPLHFQATDLGRYLLYGSQKDFVAKADDAGPVPAGPPGAPAGQAAPAAPAAPAVSGGSNDVVSADQPSESADWTVTRSGSTYLFRLHGRYLAVDRDGDLVMAARPGRFGLRLTTGCAHWPEVQTNVSGRPFRGTSHIQEVRGYLDGHTHGMAFEFLGGDVHCGRPWHPYGVTYALRDCPDHYPADGRGAALENLLRTGNPAAEHDPVGWPTFKDWPAPRSLTHEGTYYKWLERSYRGGLRLFVNLLVENDKLCQVYPIKHNSCDDMDSIRLQARDMYKFQRYIDAQSGGPGEGWYRIVTNPFQARKVINEGKLAVVMGIETSVLFGCTMKVDVPQCDEASIDTQLAQVHRMGVRQMELVNKFDNALSGVAGDEGQTGVAVNSANFLETGSYWGMKTCPESYAAGVHDKEQLAGPPELTGRDTLFGAIMEQYGGPVSPPVYPSAPHCNYRGLTDLGAHTIRQMAARHMIFDPDHMSVAGRKSSLTLLERLRYPGVVSSHSWSTPDAYPRIYRLGGVVTPYAGDSKGFVAKWRRHLGWADPRYYFGFGYGADINGLGAQGDPRGAHARKPVRYPFRGLGGVTIRKQHSGKRVYDINVDGVAHYGLYPDWIEDLRRLSGNAIVDDMSRGPEAYLQMWERAVGVDNDGCRDASAMKPVGAFRDLRRGSTTRQVLLRAGQPHSRLGDTFGYCARTSAGRRTTVRLTFDHGRLSRVT